MSLQYWERGKIYEINLDLGIWQYFGTYGLENQPFHDLENCRNPTKTFIWDQLIIILIIDRSFYFICNTSIWRKFNQIFKGSTEDQEWSSISFLSLREFPGKLAHTSNVPPANGYLRWINSLYCHSRIEKIPLNHFWISLPYIITQAWEDPIKVTLCIFLPSYGCSSIEKIPLKSFLNFSSLYGHLNIEKIPIILF